MRLHGELGRGGAEEVVVFVSLPAWAEVRRRTTSGASRATARQAARCCGGNWALGPRDASG